VNSSQARSDAEIVGPRAGVPYPLVLRGLGQPAWRAGVGIVMALGLYVLVVPLVSTGVLGLGYALQRPGESLSAYEAAGRRLEHPVGMLAGNLGLASLTLVAWFSVWTTHRVRPRWLSSVQPGLRWRYLLLCGAAAVLVLGSVLAVTSTVGPGLAWAPQPQLAGFLVVIVLTSPLQAAAEEYLFRGYLLQAMGSLAATPWFGVVASAVLFAALHGSQNLPLFLDRLAFGLLAAVLVWRTGGLEAAIAAHVANNVLAYGSAALTSSVAGLRAVRELTWANAALDVGGFAVVTAAAILLSRHLRIVTPEPAPKRPPRSRPRRVSKP